MSQKEKKEYQAAKSKAEIASEIKEKKKRVRTVILRGFIIGILCIMTTYAWFTSQKDITVSNLRGTVEVVENMEISLDAKEWAHLIDLSEIIDGKSRLQYAVDSRNAATSGTLPNIEPRELLPVSTAGGVGGVTMPMYSGEGTRKLKTTGLKDIKLLKELDGTSGIDHGYFAFDIYIRNMAREDTPDTLQLNLNSAAQVLTEEIEKEVTENGVTTTRKYIGKAYSGIQNTVRVALALYEKTAGAMASQKEALEATKDSTITDIAIWEPNAPYHVQYIVTNNNMLIGSGAKQFENGDELTTYALTEASTQGDATIKNVYDTDTPGLAVQKTVQTSIASTEEGKEDYRILGRGTTDKLPIDLVDTDGDLFQIAANQISRLRVYIWIEGQDIDCINLASEGGGIEVDLGLTKDDYVGDVLNEDYDGGKDQNQGGYGGTDQGAEGGNTI